MRDSFVMYASYFEAIEALPAKKAKELMMAIGKFAFYDEDITETIEDKMVRTMFKLIKPQLEANRKRYEASMKAVEAKKQKTKNQRLANDDTNDLTTNDTTIKQRLGKRTLNDEALNDSEILDILLSNNVNEEFVNRLIKYRKEVKKPFKTLRGLKGVLKDFAKTSDETFKSFDELFEIMSEKEWLTIKSEYLSKLNNNQAKSLNLAQRNQLAVMEAISEFENERLAVGV